jgi:hypothetical protein
MDTSNKELHNIQTTIFYSGMMRESLCKKYEDFAELNMHSS